MSRCPPSCTLCLNRTEYITMFFLILITFSFLFQVRTLSWHVYRWFSDRSIMCKFTYIHITEIVFIDPLYYIWSISELSYQWQIYPKENLHLRTYYRFRIICFDLKLNHDPKKYTYQVFALETCASPGNPRLNKTSLFLRQQAFFYLLIYRRSYQSMSINKYAIKFLRLNTENFAAMVLSLYWLSKWEDEP